MNLRRQRRRIQDIASVGFIPIVLAVVLLESNSARLMTAMGGVIYAAVIAIWIFRCSPCPKCGSLLSTRDIKLGQTTITVPWFFRPSCQRCGWVEGDNVEEES